MEVKSLYQEEDNFEVETKPQKRIQGPSVPARITPHRFPCTLVRITSHCFPAFLHSGDFSLSFCYIVGTTYLSHSQPKQHRESNISSTVRLVYIYTKGKYNAILKHTDLFSTFQYIYYRMPFVLSRAFLKSKTGENKTKQKTQ